MRGRECELCRAALGATVYPLHPARGYLGRRQRKIPLLEVWNLFFCVISFKKLCQALSPPACAMQPALKQK